MNHYTYIIIGNGIAGTTAAAEIRKHDTEGTILIVTDEPTPFYSRVRLNEYLAQEIDREQIIVHKPAWYEKNRIELRIGTRVEGAGSAAQMLRTNSGEEIGYDKLLLAQGASSFIPPIPGFDQNGVHGLRSIEDADAIISISKKAKQIILIGGGLLGLEAGYALSKLGKPIHVVEFFPRLLPRQLDDDASKRLIAQLEPMGLTFHLGAETAAINGQSEVTGITLKDETTIAGELVIISAGVRPNTTLAKQLGLDCDRGIVVNDHLQTSNNRIYSAGDAANHNGMNYGIWPAAMNQGKIAGQNMAGKAASYSGTVMANSLKVAGVQLGSAGNIDAEHKLALISSTTSHYKKLVVEHDRIVGCIMLGDITGFNKITRHIKDKTRVDDIDKELLM